MLQPLKASVQAVVIFKISCLQDEAAQGRILPDIEGHVIFPVPSAKVFLHSLKLFLRRRSHAGKLGSQDPILPP